MAHNVPRICFVAGLRAVKLSAGTKLAKRTNIQNAHNPRHKMYALCAPCMCMQSTPG